MIWTRSGVAWTVRQQVVGTGYDGTEPEQGYSVALAADGNTLAVGGMGDAPGGIEVGATWIFTRISGVWTRQGSKLRGRVPWVDRNRALPSA